MHSMVCGVDDEERCILITHMYGYACVECIIPYVRVRACELAFVTWCAHKCGETRVSMFVSVVTLHVWG